jgi:protein-S-isoprenylcysteine O-methyltransferase Ste14
VLKALSVVFLLIMVAAMAGLYMAHALLSPLPFVIAAQVAAVALMLWARATFGGRSFHGAANPTAGGLVTSGPYHFIRHPIYTAAVLFGWAGVLAHRNTPSIMLGVLLLAGAFGRMGCEETLVAATYPEYKDYAKKTKRMLPFVF